MAKGLGITGILNKESLAITKATHTVRYISTVKLQEHTKNRHYVPARIEVLARSIEDRGLQSPIVVAQTGIDAYVVISGHRRLAAYRFLAAEGKGEYETIPAIVREHLDEDLIEEDMIDGNLFTEMPTPAELAQQLARKKELLQRRKASGEKIPGKLLDIIAKELGINSEAARRMDTINRRAIPEVQEEFAAGNLSLHEAYQAARYEPEEQQKLLKQRQSGEIDHIYSLMEDGSPINVLQYRAKVPIVWLFREPVSGRAQRKGISPRASLRSWSIRVSLNFPAVSPVINTGIST